MSENQFYIICLNYGTPPQLVQIKPCSLIQYGEGMDQALSCLLPKGPCGTVTYQVPNKLGRDTVRSFQSCSLMKRRQLPTSAINFILISLYDIFLNHITKRFLSFYRCDFFWCCNIQVMITSCITKRWCLRNCPTTEDSPLPMKKLVKDFFFL